MKILIDGDVVLYLALARGKEDNLEEAKERFTGIITDVCEAHFVGVENAEVYLSTDGANFRKNTYDTYKANRKDKTPPPNLANLKEWVFKEVPNVYGSPGGEADDELLMRASYLTERREPWVIGTIDKDLRTMPGRFYNLRTQERVEVTEAEAYTFMMQQFIMGDPVDGITGIPGMGPKKTQELIHEGMALEEMYDAIKDTWQEKRPETWVEELDSTFNCAFIRRERTDLWPLEFAEGTFDDFLDRLRLPIYDHPIRRRNEVSGDEVVHS